MTFLTGWQVALAADLLRKPDATVGSVATKVGCGSPFALSTAFKRVRGVSPREHRVHALDDDHAHTGWPRWATPHPDRGPRATDGVSVEPVGRVGAMDQCDVCGFVFETVPRAEVGPRVVAAAEAIAALLSDHPAPSKVQPNPARWSILEYGAHVRDVFLTIRDRLVIGLVEEDPAFKPLYRDERINRGLYVADTPEEIAAEVEAAATMFVRLFAAIDPDLLGRPVRYGHPNPQPRTLLWMGRQAVHEAEHHYGDMLENLKSVTPAG